MDSITRNLSECEMKDALEAKNASKSLNSSAPSEADLNHLASLEQIADTLIGEGMYEEALDKAEEIFNLRCSLYGEKHPDTIFSLTRLYMILCPLGRNDEAMEVFKKEIELCLNITDESNPEHC